LRMPIFLPCVAIKKKHTPVVRNAEVMRVALETKAGTTERTTNVRYLPMHSWLQNLLLTPAYADNLISFREMANKDFKVHVLAYSQRS